MRLKFLLHQKIKFKRIDSHIKVYPGNSYFMKIANNLFINYEAIKKQNGDYFNVHHYLFSLYDFYCTRLIYKSKVQNKRKQFYSQDSLVQLVKILKYIFKRNKDAKIVSKYSSQINAYDDKVLFLDIALNIAKNIKYPFFKYGFQEDPEESYHNIIYYFEIEDLGQVSFHSSKIFDNVPDFSGIWNGIKNIKYPFDLRKIKKLIQSSLN